MAGFEVNFDGLVGPTHHYAGLSFGNEASIKNSNSIANPKMAAKQGLLKMKALADLGLKQAVLPPQERPHVPTLRRLGFRGNEHEVILQAKRAAPELLSSLSSASSMWVANAVTVSPSADSADGRIHFTASNLNNKFHRSIEHETTNQVFEAIFSDEKYFAHHQALPEVSMFGDEGAANHNRLSGSYDQQGIEVFVYGQEYLNQQSIKPKKYPARQTKESCEAIARLHQLDPSMTMLVQQHPDAIDSGVFHNDVIAVSNQQVFFLHEHAFLEQQHVLSQLQQKMERIDQCFYPIVVPNQSISIKEAVSSYLFNSQIVTRADQGMTIIVPEEARQNKRVWLYLNEVLEMNTPIDQIQVFDLRESMRNGGGPACLRLRVAVNENELAAINNNVFMNEALFKKLNLWIDTYYRDELSLKDLADPLLLQESRAALDELTRILRIGSVYSFQQI
ncbi:N-succinylarginine dihydrolase [Acinetobacter soli]|uniref:N-succinylarginine dihydrolase n=1 Tax=Acinetobacter soli TaxID=487316 RepID=A0A1P8EN73_9GAMM|nr:N-succinylarginine dihydrolase [Acinetobacter soli]APV37656.1 N-succinylarginine dihydrolase [Acinetobacter soli]